jgi:hypothetical protein
MGAQETINDSDTLSPYGRGYTLESSEAETDTSKPPKKARAKGRRRTIVIVAVLLIVVMVVLVVLLNGNNNTAPKPEFEIINHSAFAEENSTDGFNATVTFTVNNTGTTPGNATIIFKVINGKYTWAGAQIFYLEPGQSVYSYKKHIPVTGNADDDWQYQCFINGEKAVKYPHD